MSLARLSLALIALTLVACASSATPTRPTTAKPPTPKTPDEWVSTLEDQQTTSVVAFDSIAANDERCDTLCYHLSQICSLGEQICVIARSHPSQVTEGACERARATCEGTRDRVPPECLCGQG